LSTPWIDLEDNPSRRQPKPKGDSCGFGCIVIVLAVLAIMVPIVIKLWKWAFA